MRTNSKPKAADEAINTSRDAVVSGYSEARGAAVAEPV